MRDYVRRRYGRQKAPPHIWLGVSVEDRARLSRLRHLAQTPATIRFLSLEPLLGPIGRFPLAGISWVIAGGESGPGARPMDAEWVREIRDQCLDARVPFFFKQWGGRHPKSGGRELDGRQWSEWPSKSSTPRARKRQDPLTIGARYCFQSLIAWSLFEARRNQYSGARLVPRMRRIFTEGQTSPDTSVRQYSTNWRLISMGVLRGSTRSLQPGATLSHARSA